MIVRSQDRKTMTTDLNFEICENNYIHSHTFEIFNNTVGSMGEYSTEEKAIAVLDMIQMSYTRHTLFSITYQDGLLNGMARNWSLEAVGSFVSPVFQMPKDADVCLESKEDK